MTNLFHIIAEREKLFREKFPDHVGAEKEVEVFNRDTILLVLTEMKEVLDQEMTRIIKVAETVSYSNPIKEPSIVLLNMVKRQIRSVQEIFTSYL